MTNSKRFLQLGNGKWINKAECEKLKKELADDVLKHWDEFEQSLSDKQRKQIIAE